MNAGVRRRRRRPAGRHRTGARRRGWPQCARAGGRGDQWARRQARRSGGCRAAVDSRRAPNPVRPACATTPLKDPVAYRAAIDAMLAPYAGMAIDIVVGMESRGFIFSAPMAYQLGAGLVPVRKLGKLPAETISVEYALEYGSNTLEVHRDAIQPGQKVLIVDDLLATGGTVNGTVELVQRLKGEIVGLAFLVELGFLKGRDRLAGHTVSSVITF